MLNQILVLGVTASFAQSTYTGVADDLRLHDAALAGDTAAAAALLDEGVFTDTKDGQGRTPLHFAAAGNHVAVIVQLLQHGVAINAVDNQSWTPLMMATNTGSPDAVRTLLSYGANALAEAAGETALMMAEIRGNDEIGAMLEEASSALSNMMDATIAEDRVYVAQETDVQPRRERGPPPQYPEELRRAGVEGGCWVTFVVEPDGRVNSSTVRTLACTHPSFALPTRTVIRGSVFSPGRVGDVAVKVRVGQRIGYTIRR